MRLGSRGRYDHLDEIRTLDPYDDADRDRIVTLTGRYDFPWDFDQGTAIAFLRDYGVPTISRLLDRTREFEDHGVKRYDDTLFFQEEAILEGVESERSHTAIRRLNRIHGHYDIPNDEFQYVLATTIVGPVRWIGRYGWRDLDPVELVAMTRFTTRFGELMGIKGLPQTYAGYQELLDSYEAERFEFDPANKRVTEATIRIGRATAPWYLKVGFRRVSHRADGRAAAASRWAWRSSRAGWSVPSTSGCGCGPRRCGSSGPAPRRTSDTTRPTPTATSRAGSDRRRCWTS